MSKNQRTVLIVDDCSEDREIYEYYLRRDKNYTYNILHAETGEEAVQVCAQKLPDVVLLDILLPSIDGLEVLSQLRSIFSSSYLPVIMLTGQGDEQVAVAVMKSGAADYLVKNKITSDSLRVAVNYIYEKNQLQQQLEISQKRFYTSIDNLLDCFCICKSVRNGSGKIIDFYIDYMNTAACQEHRVKAEEIIGKKWSDNIVDFWKNELFDNCCHVVETSESLSKELLLYSDTIQKYNLTKAVDIKLNKLNDGFVICWHDITPRVQAEMALQQQLEQQRLVLEIAQRIRESLNLREILQTTVEEVRQFLQTDRVIIFQFDPTWTGTVVVESVAEGWREILSTQIYDPCFEENYVEPYKQGLVTAKSDIYTAGIGTCHLELLANFQVRANLVVPILQGDNLWGLIIAHHCQSSRDWKVTEIDFLRQLAMQVGIAIQQSNLFEQLQQAKADLEQRVAARTAELQAKEKLLNDFFNASAIAGIGLGINDDQKRFLKLNQGLAHINGLPLADHMGKTIDEILPPVLSSAVNTLFDRVIATGEPILNVELQGETASQPGVQRNWLVNYFPTLVQDGSVTAIGSVVFEVTERKLAEAILRQSEERLQLALEGAGDGLWDWNITTGELYLSPRWLNMLGYAMEDLPEIINAWEMLIHPDDKPWVHDILNAHLQDSSVPYAFDYRVLTKSGAWKWIANYGKVVARDPQGHPLRMTGLHKDISDRKQTEFALQQQVERERLMVGIIQHIRKTLNLEDVLSTTVTELLGFFQADRVLVYRIESNSAGRVVAEAVTPGWDSLLNLVYSAETCPVETRQQFLQGQISTVSNRESGEIVPCMVEFLSQIQVQANLVVPIIQQNRLWGLLIVHQCRHPREWLPWECNLLQQLANQMAIAIQQSELYQQLQAELTERQQIEEALRQSESQFRSLSENSPVGIFRTNTAGECTYTNPRCQDICGFTFAEALGEGWMQFLHPDDRDTAIAQWTNAVSANQVYAAEVRYLHKDGMIRYCRVQTAPICASSGELTGYVGSIEDITESRAIAQLKNEFISIVSHELRTPLTSLRGSLGLLASGVYDNKPEKGKRMLAVAAESTARLVRLVNDILDLERLESGKVPLIQQKCDATYLMEQSVEAMKTNAQQNKITLSYTPLNLQVWASPDAIIQALTNLLSNAIKFSEPGSTVWLSAKIHQGNKEEENISSPKFPNSQRCVLFAVQDRGRGIPADKLETIFEKFQQVDASDSREKGGTGLGLAICRSIVHQHGGNIWVESVLGEGSTFYFTLPLA
ncbi:GAF domain-containing protein [Scytonema sp. UIC 10036]|uniref:GAF domain-containing protein n=1 Tax=Scytonema sp. UIC 10036 TaxID=2304196 RepID=UPI001FAA8842|nr:GAF domain-containing protein [Scytonema sp. UIC 10036]